ncbi:MAG: alanine--tRNA ligase [Chloroflexi bacterium]|nr:MAG: alanine--tRNA ligase [Chloroflexota bacterium]
MKPTTSNEIRQAFLDFFNEMQHQVVASAPLPQKDNPTLLFTNAGMNQFVDVFLGKEKRPYNRATTSQKCMRVQGKHNDLENVGPSPRHHTFFEMLGNFSFGDYFKAGAIRYGYDFLTKVCQIPDDRLYYTVHTSDNDAYNIWLNEIGVPEERILRMGDKTNFWMMGDVGPCGPTSEIHYDWGPEACTCGQDNCSVLLDNDCDRWLEVWNLVFMQFDQGEDGTRTPLPQTGVDTGMGLDRLTSVIQNTQSNYDNDLFAAAMDKVQAMLGDSDKERQEKYVGYRVIGDHSRASTFLIADGVRPGAAGASYVLRMIIRRAARFGWQIGFTQPFLADVAQIFIDEMSEHYPELRRSQDHIKRTLTQEERRFARTVDQAIGQLMSILEEMGQKGETEISGEAAFDLYATYGLPLEITRDLIRDRNITIDEPGYVAAREKHALASGSGAFKAYERGTNKYGDLLVELVESGQLGETGVEYDPYIGPRIRADVLSLIKEGKSVPKLSTGDKAEIITAATPFYVEAGGEVSDTGVIDFLDTGAQFRVDDVAKPVPGLVIHMGEVVKGEISVGEEARLLVDDRRRSDIRRNHTATHILHRELRAHLGSHVTQQGSLVAPDRLRFDFSHDQAVDKETLAKIEADINSAILANYPVRIHFMDQEEAIDKGAMALFGEKYGDIVRTITIGDDGDVYSMELCGGLHVGETNDIGQFRFVGEGAVAAGVRRVEAVTGRGAQALIAERLSVLARVEQLLNAPLSELETRLSHILAENKALQKEIGQLQRQVARSQFEGLLAQVQEVAGVNLLAAQVDVADVETMREMADWFRDKVGSGVAVLAAVSHDKPLFIATVSDDLIKRGVKAGDIVREVARVVGGGGGGRPNMAQAGGRDARKIPEALDIVAGLVAGMLSHS